MPGYVKLVLYTAGDTGGNDIHQCFAIYPRCPTDLHGKRNSLTAFLHSFVNRENRVPYYQRLFQEGGKKHIRQWQQVCSMDSPTLNITSEMNRAHTWNILLIQGVQTQRGNYILRVYTVALWGGFGGKCIKVDAGA